MNSLRSRLTLGVALAAIVPLALAMLVFARQIRATLDADADRLLSREISELTASLAADDQRTSAKLRIVAADPTLKRSFLVRTTSARELAEDLASRRFLLGLDALEISDTSGAVVAADSIASRAPMMRASAPILYQGRAVGRLAGGTRIDGAFLSRISRGGALELALANRDGTIAAATIDSAQAAQALAPRALSDHPARIQLARGSYLAREAAVDLGEAPSLRLIALTSTASADAMISALQLTALLLGLLALAAAVALAALWSSQVSRPVEAIAAFSSRLAGGEWDEPLQVRGVRELETLAAALDRMRDDLIRYRRRLVTSERQAAWGLMARQVAHEIKNPLTPIAISVADLKRSYEQQRADFPAVLDQAARTVAAEIESLKRLLQEFSEFGRMAPPRLAPVAVRALFASLAALYGREVASGRLAILPPAAELSLTGDADQLRQALVNLAKNGLEAIGPGGVVEVAAADIPHAIEITVTDNGPGLTDEQRAGLFTPGFSTKAEGAGLGLTIVERIVVDHGGTIEALEVPGGGTRFRLRIPHRPRS